MSVKNVDIMVDSKRVHEFRKRIIEWGKRNIIEYPWRKTRNPYRILIAEMLLHRTRSEQVVPLYMKFLERFPSIEHLSRADYEEVEKILRPAGLRWRIRQIYRMAQVIAERYGYRIPEDYDDLKSLPGVSDYIASAVRCFAFEYPEPILDTNTVRIAGRVFGLRISDSSRRSKKFRKIMEIVLDKENPKLFNYSLIDFGKLVCRAREPLCRKCPVMHICEYAIKMIENEAHGEENEKRFNFRSL